MLGNFVILPHLKNDVFMLCAIYSHSEGQHFRVIRKCLGVVSTAFRQKRRLNICVMAAVWTMGKQCVVIKAGDGGHRAQTLSSPVPGPPSHQLFGRMDDNHLLWREIRALVLVFFLIIWIIHSLIVKFAYRGNSSSRPVNSSSMSSETDKLSLQKYDISNHRFPPWRW